MNGLVVKGVGKDFPGARVISKIDLKVGKGEFVAVLGPNGCGKTTLLNIIAGAEKPSRGTVLVAGNCGSNPRFGFVHQNYNESLFPWRTLQGNVEFALECRGSAGKKKEAERALHEISGSGLDIFSFRNCYPYQTSGGMRQLTAIARAFALKPDIMLMDEPMSSLDYGTKQAMEQQIEHAWLREKTTTVFVSHDIDGAIYLADRVVVLSKRPSVVSEIVRVGLPRPRSIEMRTSAKFLNARKKLITAFGDD